VLLTSFLNRGDIVVEGHTTYQNLLCTTQSLPAGQPSKNNMQSQRSYAISPVQFL
jgi:hypothetical protein